MRNRPATCSEAWFAASKTTRADLGNNVRNFLTCVRTPSAIIKKLCSLETFIQLGRGANAAYHGGGGSYGVQKVMALLRLLAKDPRNHKLWPAFILFTCYTLGRYLVEPGDEKSELIAANIAEYPEDYEEDFLNFLRVVDEHKIMAKTYGNDWCDDLAEILDEV